MDDSTARRILGVGPYASREQAREAYKQRAKMVHPDRHAYAAADARGEAERAMRELNEAWHTIQHGRPAPTGVRYQHTETPERRPSPPPGCELCGYTPAIRVDVRALTGIVLIHMSDRYAGTLCRSCGTGICRDVQAQTLTRGWWGVPAVLVNVAVLVNNAAYMRALRDTPWPQQRASDMVTPMSQPQPLTRKVMARPLPWLSTLTAATVLALALVLLVLNS